MISVQQAEGIILSRAKHFGSEPIAFEATPGRVLAQDITADRDMPPFNRVAMDGIALRYEGITKGLKSYRSKGVQAAGDAPLRIEDIDECVEIMTGCALPPSADTVVRYEDVQISGGVATLLTESIEPAQNVHPQGGDKRKGDVVARAGQVITPALINVVASVGAKQVLVRRLPKVVIVSTGNELVEVDQEPGESQIRRSNSYALQAVLKPYGVQAHLLHIPDDLEATRQQLQQCLSDYEVIVLSGGVSAGRFDYLPQALEEAGVEKLFHKVSQKPGKPFWFGQAASGTLVFALPGNPVSTFLCLHRYFIPWLKASLGMEAITYQAVLAEEVSSTAALPYFLQVKLRFTGEGQLSALPLMGNGSGDLAHLAEADAFMELPAQEAPFRKGERHRVWPFKDLI